MSRRSTDSGRQAVVWLATTFVIVIGAGASAFVIFAGTDRPERPFMIWGLSFAGLVLLLAGLNLRWEQHLSRLRVWLMSYDRSDPTDVYRAARRSAKSREQFGSNQPPSIETVRDAAKHNGAWIPHGSTAPQRLKRR
jgi:hypothetical protein